MNRKRVNSTNSIPVDRCHLFRIRTPHALAKRLGWELNKLDVLAADGGYRVFKLKDSGRVVQEPGKALQSLHRQIHKYLSRIEVPAYLHSAVKGRSYISNATSHVGQGGLIKIDIAKFYQSVPQHKVMHFFRDYLECAEDVSGLLANLICYDGYLPTGSSVSPIVSYFAFKPLFDSLYDLATDHNLIMTCYVDDITMSGPRASASVLHEARKLIFRAGLRAHKDRQFGSGPGRMVTGVIVGDERLHLPFSRWKKIRADVRAISGAQTVAEKLAIYPRLTSRLYEAAQIDPCCRALAKYHHHQWKALKRSASEPALQAA